MRLLLYGATGMLGQRILAEAVDRGHEVTAAARNPDRVQELPGVTLRQGDVLDADSVASLAEGHDAIVSAVGPGHAGDPCFLVEAARCPDRRRRAHRRAAGGPGRRGQHWRSSRACCSSTTSDFAATWMGVALAHRDALDLYRSAPRGRGLDLREPGRHGRARRADRAVSHWWRPARRGRAGPVPDLRRGSGGGDP